MASTITEVAAQLSEVLDRWSTFVQQVSDWATKPPDGGPNGDGEYPLTDSKGDVMMVPGLRLILDEVQGPAETSREYRDESREARDESQDARDTADTHRSNAKDHRDAAETARGYAESAAEKAHNARQNVEGMINQRYPNKQSIRIPEGRTVTPSTDAEPGTFSWDENYLYLHTENGWTKIPLNAL